MKGKMGKSVLAVLLGIIILIGSLGGCKKSPSDNGEKSNNDSSNDVSTVTEKQYVIGVAEAQSTDEVATRRRYFENYVANEYNVKFIFSEQCSDDADTKAFIENCIDAGADAIIDFKSGTAQMANTCKENGLIYVFNGKPAMAPTLMDASLENFAGFVGADNKQTAGLFSDWLEDNASLDGTEGFLISSILASSGNSQHSEITRAILEALQNKYNLTYDKSIEDLVASTDTIDVNNDKDIQITIYPGSSNKDTWLPGVSSLIQSGKYGVFLSAGVSYNQSATVVNEVESALNMNIKVASIGALGNTLTTAFNTDDPNGNPSLDMATVKSASILSAALFAITYNGLYGANEQCARDSEGMPYSFDFAMIGVTSPEQLAQMEGWDDKDTQNWIANTKVIDSMLVTKNPDITADDIQKFLSSLDFETIKSLME